MRPLDLFGRMYAPAIGLGAVSDFIRRTGIEAMKGADILGTAPSMYHGEVEYLLGNIGGYLRDMVQVHNANFGTRVFFTTAPLQHLRHPRQPGRGPVQPVERRGQ